MTGRAQRNSSSSSSSFSSSTPKFPAVLLHEQSATSSLPHTRMFNMQILLRHRGITLSHWFNQVPPPARLPERAAGTAQIYSVPSTDLCVSSHKSPLLIMQRLLTFLGILTAEFVSGENRVDLLETIKAVEGDDVPLQCRLDPSLDLSAYTSDWIRVDLNTEVHAYRRKQDLLHLQMDQYRNRTTLNREDLSRGVLTLQISSVKLLDSGQYRCYVPKLNVGCVFNLTVVEKEQQNKSKRADSTTTGPPDDPGAAKNETVIVIASVCCLAPAVAVVALLVIRVKRGKIKICKKMLRPVRGKEAKTMPNNYEMENLRNQAAKRDEDPHGAAENGALHSVQHDTVYH